MESTKAREVLAVGGIAAILASSCCLGPLLLVGLGISGAWIGNLTALEPYRPLFLLLAVLALFFAGYRIFRPTRECKPGVVCAAPAVKKAYRILFWIVASLVLAAFLFPYFLPISY